MDILELSMLPGYKIGMKINPDSGDNFVEDMINLLDEKLSGDRLFELVKDKRHGSSLENIMAAAYGATETAYIPRIWIENDFNNLIQNTPNEEFRKNYDSVEKMRLGIQPVESFALAYVVYLMEKNLRTIPDFPKPPIQFKDIIPTLGKINMLNLLGEEAAYILEKAGIEYDMIASVEARGYFLAASLSAATGKGIIPIRKAGKLPPPVFQVTVDKYDGPVTLEIEDCHDYAGKRVAVFDDVIGTGGSGDGLKLLCDRVGARVVGNVYLLGVVAEGYKSKNIPGLFTFAEL